MNSSQSVGFFHSCKYKLISTVFLLLIIQSSGLNEDGLSLLSFKNSVLADPLLALQSWNVWDETPCSWRGVSCTVVPGVLGDAFHRVTGLVLSNSQLLGSISNSNLTMIQHLQILDLSNNSLTGPIPVSLFNASELQYLDLSSNLVTGELPGIINGLRNLKVLNFSDNALSGKLPSNLTTMVNLTVVSLSNNYFSGVLPSGFDSVQFMDLSSNLMNGTLPPDFGGRSLRHLNISYNRFSGEIPPEFSETIPENATIDLSFNNFTGAVPETTLFSNQETKSFSGNDALCGKALEKLCPSIPINVTPPSYAISPAIAAVPKTIESNPDNNITTSKTKSSLRPTTIIAIVIGDLAGIVIIVTVFLYVHNTKKKKDVMIVKDSDVAKDDWSNISSESKGGNKTWSCLGKKTADDDEDLTDTTESSDSDKEDHGQQNQRLEHDSKGGSLVTVDGEKKLEIETLLKASAFILGATGSSIMYKAVLEDGTALAVRRIGESGVDRFRDFENHVRVIAKLVHPNLVRIRGFYWGVDERLVIYDFVPNGCLANARYRKTGSSPCHLSWEVRLKIAKGIARGLSYLHDKKHVHGNLKPSNILLGHDMEPKIGDFGLERLLVGESSYKVGGSARNFGSKRSTISRESFPDLATGPSPSPSPSSLSCSSYYHAPESLRTLKPNPKWDVYAFGVLLLELLTGRVNDIEELGQGTGLVVEDQNRAMKMADVAIRGDLEGKEESLLACFKLGIGCVSPAPQKRPSMKDAVHVLEKIPSSTTH